MRMRTNGVGRGRSSAGSGQAVWWTALCVVLVALGQAATIASAQGSSFQGLGHLHDRVRESAAYGVSADGSVVVGYSTSGTSIPADFAAFRWTGAGGMSGLGLGRAYGVSADGAVVVGSTGSDAFRWTEAGGMVLLHGDGLDTDSAWAASADGSVVVGNTSTGGSMGIAFRWTEATGVVSLGTLDTFPWWYPYSAAYGVSADGSVIVGHSSYGDGGMQAIRRTQAEGMVGLGDLPGGDLRSSARDISADGSVIVGWGTSGSGTEAFRWTEAGGMVGLGDLPGGTFYSIAWAVSADGSVVVGRSRTDFGDEPFIWDAEHGMRNLKSVLIAGGLDLTGWTLYQATGVSADGSIVVGVGVNPEGQTEAWRATLAPLQWNEPPIASFTVETDGLTAHFDASSSSDPDGSIESYSWDFADGHTGSGVTVSHAYASPGTYTVWLTVVDNEGAVGSARRSVTVSRDADIVLSAIGYKLQGLQKVRLTWSGTAAAYLDVYRNAVSVATAANSGSYTDHINLRGRGTYVYRICEAGTDTCSNEVTVVFN